MLPSPHHLIPSKQASCPPPPKPPPSIRETPPSPLQLKPSTPRAISISNNNHVPHGIIKANTNHGFEDDTTTAFWDYQFLFMSQRSQTTHPLTLRVVDGTIPLDFPSGTYFLTGPGLFADDHGSTVHPLDGHGYLRAFHIDSSTKKVTFMARYIKTEAQIEEHDPETDTWRFTHRGPFSVLKGGRKVGNTKVMKNVANTSVLKWGDKLLCLWEGGEPYRIEPENLDTIGRFDLMTNNHIDSQRSHDFKDCRRRNGGDDLCDIVAGLLKPILYGVFNMPPKRLLSHYKVDGKRNRLLTLSCNAEDMLLPCSHFTFYEFDSNMRMLQRQEFRINDHLMIHDWAYTDTHYILFANRIKLDLMGSMRAVCGISPMISALSVNPSNPTSPIYLLPRFPNNQTHLGYRDWRKPIEAPTQMWLLHVGNAFESINQNGTSFNIQIHAASCSYQWFNFHKLFGYNWQSGKLDPSVMNITDMDNELLPHLVQISMALSLDGTSESCSVEPLNEWRKAADFPIINPEFSGHNNAYVYAATTSGSRKALPHFPFDTVAKLNVPDNSTRLWSVGTRSFIGEPIFVPKGCREDDGYILVVEYAVAKQMCYLVVLDAKKVGEADALVARLEVPRSFTFPLGFHGFWAKED